MQLNPARGRKLIQIDGQPNYAHGHGLCSSTPRGDGNSHAWPHWSPGVYMGLCSSTPRGDGNMFGVPHSCTHALPWFMQLNPARGRKLCANSVKTHVFFLSVYAAQPREGTETCRAYRAFGQQARCWFMQLNPARGRKLDNAQFEQGVKQTTGFMQLNPARGRKHVQ